jgi:hypothetical protein
MLLISIIKISVAARNDERDTGKTKETGEMNNHATIEEVVRNAACSSDTWVAPCSNIGSRKNA